MTAEDQALLRLLELLKGKGYHFVTPTPATHARVLAKRGHGPARCVEDVFGWSMPFRYGTIHPEIERALNESGMIEATGDLVRARIRVSRLGDHLYIHSAYPTEGEDAVFFGPDTYRFAHFIANELTGHPLSPQRAIDIGTGAGVGAMVIADMCPASHVIGSDVNRTALRFASLNAAHAGISIETVRTSGLNNIDARFDLIVANPPYIADPGCRQYRDGGGALGGDLSIELARQAVAGLAPGGRLLLYTGSAIVRGRDHIREALEYLAREQACIMRYREIDPDVFGEEIEQPAYAEADRIAAVGAVIEAVS